MAEVASTEQLPVKLGQEYRGNTFPRENAYHTLKCESDFYHTKIIAMLDYLLFSEGLYKLVW